MSIVGFLFAAIVAAITAFVIGMLWYGPFLFGKQWMALAKLKKKDMKPAMNIVFWAFLRQFVTALIIIQLFTSDAIKELAVALGTSVFWTAFPTLLIIWVGFTAMPALSDVLWLKRPVQLYLINMGYELISFIAMLLILTSWL